MTQKKTLRFSEIKPRGLESNRFMYHLVALMNDGLVKKVATTYLLTAKGKQFADRVSHGEFTERIQPKIVTLLVVSKDNGYLLYRRGHQPFLSKVGFPYGKIHLGERIEEAAHRELKEKTGLSVSQLTYCGDVYITVHDEEDLITHMLCHVFSGTDPKGTLTTEASIGECFWAPPDLIPAEDRIPGFTQVLRLIKKNHIPFFAEYFLDVHEV